jgi:hypothetical protein
MWASYFQWLLYNLQQLLPATSIYYLPPEEAHQRLQQLTKQDFGYDACRWEEWGRANDQFFPGT